MASFKKELILESPKGWFNLRLDAIWNYRELLIFFVWKNITVRYKQTVLGVSWAIIQPLMTMVIFSVIFGNFAKLPSDGIPYPIFSYTALLPWQLFSRGVSDATSSLVTNQNMIKKTYFPRILLPMSSILSGLVDFAIAFLILIGMMFFYKIQITWNILWIFAFIPITMIAAMAAGLWLSALNVQFRDFKYFTPFFLQALLYSTPIAYSISIIPEKWRIIYGVNPMVGVVNGFRWALLGQQFDLGPEIIISLIFVFLLFIGGLFYFQRMESFFADLV